jgi:hypothetical protein
LGVTRRTFTASLAAGMMFAPRRWSYRVVRYGSSEEAEKARAQFKGIVYEAVAAEHMPQLLFVHRAPETPRILELRRDESESLYGFASLESRNKAWNGVRSPGLRSVAVFRRAA